MNTSVKIVPSADMGNAPQNARTLAAANALAVKSVLGVVYGVAGSAVTAQFLQIHDSAAAPAGGAVPNFSIPIAAGAPFSVDFGAYGMFCANGIQIAISSTQHTYTAGATDAAIYVRFK